MKTRKQTSEFYGEYGLANARRHGVAKSPFPHQEAALRELGAVQPTARSRDRRPPELSWSPIQGEPGTRQVPGETPP